MLHPYEEKIREKINKIANEDIYFKPSEIMQKSEDVVDNIICELLSDACCGQNVLPIEISRELLLAFPKKWISSKIKKLAFRSIDINDDWDYRRLLELSELISKELLIWAIALSDNSENPDIIEASYDFKLTLKNRL